MLTAEALKKANDQIKTIPIRDKNYAQVTERVKAFREICPGGKIETEIISLDNGVVTMKATVFDEEGHLVATGFAQEKETSSFINKTSFVENCETSAVGRALGFAGIGSDGSIASAEEVINAMANQGGKGNKKGRPYDNAGQQEEPQEAYPERGVMVEELLKHYPKDTPNYAALISGCFNGKEIEEATDAQIMAVYSNVKKKQAAKEAAKNG